VPSVSFIKKMYDDRVPDGKQTKYKVATFDIETDVFKGETIEDHPITIVSVAMDDHVYVTVNKEWLPKKFHRGAYKILQTLLIKYLKKYTDKGLTANFVLCEDETETIKKAIQKAHEWKPDILAIWNMNFDIRHIERRSEVLGFNLKLLWADPDIPAPAAEYKYVEGRSFRVTASGKTMTIPPAARWHSVTISASFTIIDAMCTYRNLRSQAGEEPSYSLDAILGKELGERKLKFKEADKYVKLAWHQFMQKNYPMEYIIYNVFDSYSMILLDRKTSDLEMVFPQMMEYCPYSTAGFSSTKNDIYMYFFSRSQGYIMGSPDFGDKEKDKNKPKALSPKGWIVTLPAANMVAKGARCLKELAERVTNIFKFTMDEDLVGAYPSIGAGANVSKETTKNEIVCVKGVDPEQSKRANINIMSGNVNALDYGTQMFDLPRPRDVAELF
jgi:hypothetical protein